MSRTASQGRLAESPGSLPLLASTRAYKPLAFPCVLRLLLLHLPIIHYVVRVSVRLVRILVSFLMFLIPLSFSFVLVYVCCWFEHTFVCLDNLLYRMLDWQLTDAVVPLPSGRSTVGVSVVRVVIL